MDESNRPHLHHTSCPSLELVFLPTLRVNLNKRCSPENYQSCTYGSGMALWHDSQNHSEAVDNRNATIWTALEWLGHGRRDNLS